MGMGRRFSVRLNFALGVVVVAVESDRDRAAALGHHARLYGDAARLRRDVEAQLAEVSGRLEEKMARTPPRVEPKAEDLQKLAKSDPRIAGLLRMR